MTACQKARRRPVQVFTDRVPVEDPENLDRRRASAGPRPFADYEASMRRAGDG